MSVKEAVGLTGKHKLLVAGIIGAAALFVGWQMATHGYFGAKVQAKATKIEAKLPQKTTTQSLVSNVNIPKRELVETEDSSQNQTPFFFHFQIY